VKTLPIPLLVLACCGFAIVTSAQDANDNPDAKQDGKIWGALYFATDSEIEKAEPGTEKTKATLEKLAKAFEEKHYQLLGEHTQAIFSEYESWVVPSKDIFLKIDSKGPAKEGKGINLHLQLWRDKNVLLKTDVVLRDTPIFIRGPKWGNGYLIMAIELR
jgi:hypothetical protein